MPRPRLSGIRTVPYAPTGRPKTDTVVRCHTPPPFVPLPASPGRRKNTRPDRHRNLGIRRPTVTFGSMHRRNPHDGNAGSTRPPHSEETPRFLRPIGVDTGLQQCELNQIVLRAATANAFVFPYERRKRIDRAGKIPALERVKAMRQHRKVRAGRVTPISRQFLDLPSTSVECG